MAESLSPRLGLHRWSDSATDTFSRDELDSDHAALEALVAIARQGPAASRGSATTWSRSFYMSDESKALDYSDGTAWHRIGTPAGAAMPLFSATIPAGWLLMDGRSLVKATYPDLAAALGAAYSIDATNFALPDMRGRVSAGLDNMGGTDAGRVGAANAMGTADGAEQVTLSAAQMPSHTHAGTSGGQSADHSHAGPVHNHGGGTGGQSADHSHLLQTRNNPSNTADYASGSGRDPERYNPSGARSTNGASNDHSHGIGWDGGGGTGGASAGHTHAFTTGGAGASAAHSVMQPTLFSNWIIKA